MADTKLAKVGITVKESWKDDISYEVLDYTLWRVQDGGDGCGYIAKRANIGVVPNSDDSVWIKATQAGQSIYDLAVKYGHFVGTEEEFEAEYQAALQAARDAASETSATNAEIQEAEELRRASEDERVDAETARQGSEIAREAMESDRQIAENMRQMAETQRGENETTRQSQETARESSETQRQSNESTRQSNETARESAEQERTADFEALKTDMETAIGEADAATAAAVALNNQVAGDESARQQAEQSRVAAETQRQTAETQRGTNEQTRQTQETARQTAEQTRNTQETARQTAEGQRATAEEGRASAESGRVSAETARQTAETARETQATTDHQRAESDHAIAAEDHATLDEKISHKADIDGSYDGMAVGIARNLEGRTDVTDSFFERTTGGDAEVANGTAQLNEVKGKSQVWNQLAQKRYYGDLASALAGRGLTAETIDGVVHISGTTTVANAVNLIDNLIDVINGHKYIMFCDEPNVVGVNYYISGISQSTILGRNWTKAATTSGNYRIGLYLQAGTYTDVALVFPCFVDLTAIFGAGNEPATVEEFEAWLAENIGEQAYYPFNAGEVLNNRMTGVESIGFNLLDPATGKADIIGAYSDVYGNYYGITGTHGAITFTDKFGNTETITPDEDGKFLLEKAGTLSVADAGEDCAVFLWWDGTQTEYKPYEKNVGALDVTHIYGKLNGEGEYVRVWPTGMPGIGDIKDSLKVVDGQVVAERKIAEVDMGTMTWMKGNSAGITIFFAGMESLGATQKNNFAVLTAPYIQIDYNRYDKTIRSYIGTGYQRCSIRDDAKNESTGAEFKTAMSGVLLYYELETPRVYTDLIYRDSEAFADNTNVTLPVNYKVDNWGIERIAPQNTEEAVVTAKPELTMRYSIDAVEELNTHRDEIDDLYEKNEELDERKPEKYGEYPDMAVGSAKTLAGNDTKVEDFFFKALDCADGLAKLNSARGKSLVWNQIERIEMSYENRNKFSWSNVNTDTRTYQNGIVRVDIVDTTANAKIQQTIDAPNVIGGHKYCFRQFVHTDGMAQLGYNGAFSPERISQPNGYITYVNNVASRYLSLAITVFGETGTFIEFGNIQVFDLTLMFGAGNEPATVEEFEAMFPLLYYDYNPGEIISNKTEEVKVTGFNQWDEEWEVGTINGNGVNQNATDRIRSKNYVPIIQGASYYLKAPYNIQFYWYDAAKNYLGTNGIGANSRMLSLPSNCCYCRFSTLANYGTTYNHDICINLSDPARNGEYEPYKANTIELNLPTLTGKLNGEGESVVVFPDGLKSAGSVYDEIVGNKAIKRVGKVDLGTLTWSKFSNTSRFYAPLSGAVNAIYGSGKTVNIISDFIETSPNSVDGSAEGICLFSNGPTADTTVRITKSGNDSTTPEEFKAIASGFFAYYELATPEEYILDAPLPDTFQAYKGGTIKQLPENTSEPVTAEMVMEVVYSLDAVGILTGLPKNYISLESLQAMLNAMQSAGLFTSYTLTWNESQGKYNFTFQANQ